ncbi:metallophosphoesterase family protein [Sphingobacterium yanglingense]|uniref:3',5'-cyclic AMP phosphodiesterase CpdA n=1 Tax=Sphingobacterium yanglingense TaxID=1437280 RepID=A0A4R6W4F1_9SPHI|nr:FN3 domain-containing metallophosphoesterase family protein [Sphingobacterium yanglingense]TDQ73467.1 3',5'-cyclic AMP phosphodiesterase CpdA [Sphingobacterium yanglingense]
MNTPIFTTVLIVLSFFLETTAIAQSRLKIDHGPYLQEVTQQGATVVFQTSLPSYSYIELRKENSGQTKIHYEHKHGLKQANTDFFAVRADRLEPATRYQYRIVSKEMVSFQPYKVTFGDSISTPWYTFKTIDPKSKGGSIFIISDTHSDAKKLDRMLDFCDYKTCDAFFYVGDMMNYMSLGGEHPFSSFIDVSVNKFATSIPFELVRGNHETRGDMARIFPRFFPKSNDKIYGSYLMGDIMVVMLDSGEDKADNHPVYAGITDYDNYRTEQAEWLKALVNSKEYKKAKYRIVLTHFPMVVGEKWRQEGNWTGWYDAVDKFLPILNKANVDLVVSGHTHQFQYHEAGQANNKFPQLVQGAMCATRLDIKEGIVKVKVIDTKGEVLLDKKL